MRLRNPLLALRALGDLVERLSPELRQRERIASAYDEATSAASLVMLGGHACLLDDSGTVIRDEPVSALTPAR